MRTALSGLGFALMLALAAQAHAAEIDWTKVDAALGKTASVQGEIHRYGFPRTDLQVTLDGMQVMGGYGYCMEFPMQRWLREAVLQTVDLGNTEIMLSTIAFLMGMPK